MDVVLLCLIVLSVFLTHSTVKSNPPTISTSMQGRTSQCQELSTLLFIQHQSLLQQPTNLLSMINISAVQIILDQFIRRQVSPEVRVTILFSQLRLNGEDKLTKSSEHPMDLFEFCSITTISMSMITQQQATPMPLLSNSLEEFQVLTLMHASSKNSQLGRDICIGNTPPNVITRQRTPSRSNQFLLIS